MITPAPNTTTDHPPQFATDYRYIDRKTKAKYVWLKYESILRGANILDVGADECHLKEHLDADANYWGIGIGGNPDQCVDLESGHLPFDDRSYDCLLCLDVLEHIESIHDIFDELCRVSSRYVIISLPNPWGNFWRMLRKGSSDPNMPLKFYGLPDDRPEDRHRWFFGAMDADRFIGQRADRNMYRVLQSDYGIDQGRSVSWLKRLKRRAQTIGISNKIDRHSLYANSVWTVLERTGSED